MLLIPAMTFVHGEDFFQVKAQIIRENRLKIFSLYISPALSLDNFGYNSNIYAYQGNEEPDWTADVGLNLKVAAMLEDRFILIVNECPYYSFYAKNKQEEAFNNRFQFTAYTHLGRFNLNYRFILNNTRERPNSEFGARTRQKEQKHTVSIDYGRYDRFYINIYAEQSQKEYADERYLHDYNLSSMNRDDIILKIDLNQRIFSRTRISLRGEYYDYHFRHNSERDGTGRKFSLGVDFPEISSITGTMRFGWNSFFPKNSPYSHFTKPFGSGGVSIRMFNRFKFNFSYLVDNFFSFWDINQYFDERSAAAGVEFYFSRKIKIGYDYRAGNLIYKRLLDGSKTRSDDFSTSSLFIGVRIFRKMGIALTYTMYRMNSTIKDFNRKYNFIGGNIIHEF